MNLQKKVFLWNTLATKEYYFPAFLSIKSILRKDDGDGVWRLGECDKDFPRIASYGLSKSSTKDF